ncbi:type II toxin-antitoxin system VapC family toxin [Nostoc sp. NZL]|uniref:type II toxin-antitoxin system VapC family toxin n=1 Tax=Nostoc sp. NZL TaxID=2650612 RepID=UPI001E36E038|nr:type II toxin-antitoxin system VapC family toxin [Nostoc sp. NZL]MBG1240759.1 type II toxin-antitoxin system VapC family toxin [Nostoc sp. NZL]
MIILDTHIWVWWVDDNERLIKKHREYIEEYQSQGLGVNIVSCWEVAKLVEKNRLVFACSVNEWLETALAYPGIQLLNLTLPIVGNSTQLSLSLFMLCFSSGKRIVKIAIFV